jgi:hypothetical protein
VDASPDILSPDGWQLRNPPPYVRLRDGISSFFEIDVWTLPIVEGLPGNAHPIAQALNRYYVVQVSYVPQHVVFHDNVRIFARARNANIVAELSGKKEALPLASTENHRPSKPVTWQDVSRVLDDVARFIVMLPVYVLMAVICAPFLLVCLPSYIDGQWRSFKHNQKARNVERQYRPLLHAQIKPFVARITALQQTFNPNFDRPEVAFPTHRNQGRFYVLPSKVLFALDHASKTLTVQPYHEIEIKLGFRQPYPTYQALRLAAGAQGKVWAQSYAFPKENGPVEAVVVRYPYGFAKMDIRLVPAQSSDAAQN